MIAAVIAAAGASLLIVQWAGGRSLWLDEEMIAINFRDRTLRELASPLWLGQTAPYGWLVLERLAVLLFGTGERTVRFVPLAFGVATLGAAVWIGRRWMGAAGAAVLALTCAMGEWITFHVDELKHYSADACFGLLLPALAAWTTEPPESDFTALRQRLIVFWAVATAAQWFANGALLVTPGCAAVLVIVVARRFGWRSGLQASLFGLVWLASFALNDVVSLQHARGSQFLQGFWAGAFPPPGAGVRDTARWLATQLTPLALKPGGSGFGLTFWAVAIAGLAFRTSRSPAIGLAFAAVPLSAFVFTAARAVPLFERLSLWIVPALYAGVAFAADATAELLTIGRPRRSGRMVAGVCAASLLAALCADLVMRGTTYLRVRPQAYNHELDDRDAVRWLVSQARPGDVWLTTHLALPAIWWYGRWKNTMPVLEATFNASRDCDRDDVRVVVKTGRRALIYLGFRFDDVPKGFDDLLLLRLGEVGEISGYRPYGGMGHAIIIDLRARSSAPLTLAGVVGMSPGAVAPISPVIPVAPASPVTPDGCVAVHPAHLW